MCWFILQDNCFFVVLRKNLRSKITNDINTSFLLGTHPEANKEVSDCKVVPNFIQKLSF